MQCSQMGIAWSVSISSYWHLGVVQKGLPGPLDPGGLHGAGAV